MARNTALVRTAPLPTPTSKSKRGRKPEYTKWTEGEGLLLVKGWVRDGLLDKQIAHNMGISVGTLYAWRNKFSEFDEVFKRTKEIVDYEVENALHRAAMEGNVTAQIFWLKNRRPGQWRDKQDVEYSGRVDVRQQHEYHIVQEVIEHHPDVARRLREVLRPALTDGSGSE
jgi:transposase